MNMVHVSVQKSRFLQSPPSRYSVAPALVASDIGRLTCFWKVAVISGAASLRGIGLAVGAPEGPVALGDGSLYEVYR